MNKNYRNSRLSSVFSSFYTRNKIKTNIRYDIVCQYHGVCRDCKIYLRVATTMELFMYKPCVLEFVHPLAHSSYPYKKK